MPETDILERLKGMANFMYWPASRYVYKPAIAEIESLRRELTAMQSKMEAAEGIAAALRIMIESAFPHPMEHPTMTAAWKVAREALAAWDEARKTA